jgi:predicted nucleotidyltransferase|tara:strand:+ start:166 stop:354 length:189 start_codon:yes stop_codon:yes gene_type:complete
MKSKKAKPLTKDEISFLNHLIKSLKESELKLKEYYIKKDVKNFNNIKKFMLGIQKKISEIIK